jgi:hypothetical protein
LIKEVLFLFLDNKNRYIHTDSMYGQKNFKLTKNIILFGKISLKNHFKEFYCIKKAHEKWTFNKSIKSSCSQKHTKLFFIAKKSFGYFF